MATKTLSFVEAIKACFSKFATFKGRARRSEFWWFYLAIYAVNAILGVILNYFATAKSALVEEGFSNLSNLSELDKLAEQESTYANINLIIMILMGIWFLVTLIPFLAAHVRRLHDVGKSGHMMWLYLLCGVGGLIPLIMCIADGKPEPNQYGPSPKFAATPVEPQTPPTI